MLQKLSSTKNSSWSHYYSIWGSQKMQIQNRRARVLGKNLIFCEKWPILGTRVGFWKIRQLATISDFHLQGLISKPDTRQLIWVVSRVIRTHGLAARAILVQGKWNIFWFCGGFWKIRLLVTTSDFDDQGGKWKLDTRGLIWVVLQVIWIHGLAARAVFSAGKWVIFLVPRWFFESLPFGDHLQFGLGGSHLKRLDLYSA